MIEILHYETANKNKVIGYVDFKLILNGLSFIFRKISHLQSGDRKWFNIPNLVRDKADGSPDYLRYWQFEQEVHNTQLMEELPEKVKEYCLKNKIAEVSPLDFNASSSKIDDDVFFN